MLNNNFKKWIYIGGGFLVPAIALIIAGMFTMKVNIIGDVDLSENMDGFGGMILVGIGMVLGIVGMIFIVSGWVSLKKGRTIKEAKNKYKNIYIAMCTTFSFMIVFGALPFHASIAFVIVGFIEFIPLLSIPYLIFVTYKTNNNPAYRNESKFD